AVRRPVAGHVLGDLLSDPDLRWGEGEGHGVIEAAALRALYEQGRGLDVGEGGLARGELGLQSQSLFPLPAQPGAFDVLDPTRLVHVFERGAQVRQIVLLAQTL